MRTQARSLRFRFSVDSLPLTDKTYSTQLAGHEWLEQPSNIGTSYCLSTTTGNPISMSTSNQAKKVVVKDTQKIRSINL